MVQLTAGMVQLPARAGHDLPTLRGLARLRIQERVVAAPHGRQRRHQEHRRRRRLQSASEFPGPFHCCLLVSPAVRGCPHPGQDIGQPGGHGANRERASESIFNLLWYSDLADLEGDQFLADGGEAI